MNRASDSGSEGRAFESHRGHMRRGFPKRISSFFFFIILLLTINKAEHYGTVVLEKTLESLLDFKEIQPVHSKGDQSWVFIGGTDVEAETPILWPPDAKS